jgi:hypothetical protein
VPEEPLKLANPSPKDARREDVSAVIIAEIYDHFAEDVKALQSCWRGSADSLQTVTDAEPTTPLAAQADNRAAP